MNNCIVLNYYFTIKCTDLKKLVLKFESVEDEGKAVAIIDKIGVYFTFLRLPPRLHLTLNGDFSVRNSFLVLYELCIL